jgi:A/G-specific adenine glycosylase
MHSSQSQEVSAAYLKKLPDCKEEFMPWPAGVATECEIALIERIRGEGTSGAVVADFQQLVYGYYVRHGRMLPWRQIDNPFLILVSEVMLQQTQVDRVIPKYQAFVERFSTPGRLAEAPLPELLSYWQGLGYNRRAIHLQRAARMLIEQWDGQLPEDPRLLQQLPGIGPYTAGAISTFAFNRPELFLETNIRAVLLHFFFPDQIGITDRQLLPIVEAVLDRTESRRWYNALMDYGSDLKRRFPNPSRRSSHHAVQSRFKGSNRQIRGAVVRMILAEGRLTTADLQDRLGVESYRLMPILESLLREGFLKTQGRQFVIPSA